MNMTQHPIARPERSIMVRHLLGTYAEAFLYNRLTEAERTVWLEMAANRGIVPDQLLFDLAMDEEQECDEADDEMTEIQARYDRCFNGMLKRLLEASKL